MSTRSIIGVPTDSGFRGRYCHWDGYPSSRLVQLLDTWAALDRDYRKVIVWAIKPAHRDGLGQPDGYWSSYTDPTDHAHFAAMVDLVECTYCVGHPGERHDENVDGPCNVCARTDHVGRMDNPAKTVTWQQGNGGGWSTDRDDCGAEYAYLIRPDGVSVLSSYFPDDGSKAVGWFGSLGDDGFGWRVLARVPWGASLTTADLERLDDDHVLVFGSDGYTTEAVAS